MGNLLPQATYEIWLDDPAGNRITQLSTTAGFAYSRVENDKGWLINNLPDTFDQNLITLPDGIIEIWRGFGPGTLRLENAFFIRKRKKLSISGNHVIELGGPGISDLFRRRIVAYKAESAQALMTNEADDMMKQVVRDNLGASAAAGRNLTLIGGGLTIQKDLAKGPSITKAFAWKKVDQALKDIADTAKQKGTKLCFDLVPIITDSSIIAFEFRTYTGQRGDDHGSSSSSPLYFGEEFGTLQDPVFEEDFTEESNYIYVGGQGQDATRTIEEVPDTARMARSIWNRCEDFKDARNQEDTEALKSEGNEALHQGRPRYYFSGKIVETENMRYGRDWHFGDLVVGVGFGRQSDCIISAVKVTKEGSGNETVEAWLEIEE